ncbi:MAG TPA: hypothetical protein VFA27_02600 [Vicinamibacterales bacterium]|nr:hypothetical protein [Vicinamibacterales bacterium]
MRDILKTARRWLLVGWFWPLVLIVLPNCGFQSQASTGGGGSTAGPNLNPGDPPHSSAVFCDIEKPNARHCATDDEIAHGIRLASAALALNTGATNGFALDDSPDALARCGGKPEAVPFYGTFPDGFLVCVNCGQTVNSAAYPDNNALCAAQCEDFIGTTLADGTFVPANPPDPATKAFCDQHAHPSTNFPLNGCFNNACTTAGALDPSFVDPRRAPEPVVWENLIGTTAAGSTLTKVTATSDFDAGAASTQTIARADGYVEFTAIETNTARIGGLTSGAPDADTDPHASPLNFGIGLAFDGNVFVFENGNQIGPFGTYASGDRFRVTVHDRFNGTATVIYSRVTGTCNSGAPCNEQVLFTSTTAGAYPFHADASLFSPNATLANVQFVRIQ